MVILFGWFGVPLWLRKPPVAAPAYFLEMACNLRTRWPLGKLNGWGTPKKKAKEEKRKCGKTNNKPSQESYVPQWTAIGDGLSLVSPGIDDFRNKIAAKNWLSIPPFSCGTFPADHPTFRLASFPRAAWRTSRVSSSSRRLPGGKSTGLATQESHFTTHPRHQGIWFLNGKNG